MDVLRRRLNWKWIPMSFNVHKSLKYAQSLDTVVWYYDLDF